MTNYYETERLILREVLESDIETMFELDSNTLVHRYLGNNPIQKKEDALKAIHFIRNQYRTYGVGRLATIEKSSGSFIGWSGLKYNVGEKEALNGTENFYDIGYRFLPRFWGLGFATESSHKMLRVAFEELNIDTVFGAADIDNIGSNKVLRKIGLNFVEEFFFKKERINWYELKKENYEKDMF